MRQGDPLTVPTAIPLITFDHIVGGLESAQGCVDGVQHIAGGNVLIVVAVDFSCSCHLFPCDQRMSRLQIIGQTARGFGDDLKAARHRIDRSRIVLKLCLIEAGYFPRCRRIAAVEGPTLSIAAKRSSRETLRR